MLFIVILALILTVTGVNLVYEAYFGEVDEYRDTPSSEVLAAYRRR